MGRIVPVIVPIPTNGMTNDPRDRRYGVCRVCQNFDVQTDRRRAVPYYDSESGDSAASTSQKQNFCIGLWTPSTPDEWRLFGLGVKSGTGLASVEMKMLTTGGSTDLDDDGWATPANNESASGAVRFELFHYYHKTGKIHGARANQYIWEFSPDGATAWVESKYDYGSTFTYLTQAITHSQDDVMYFGIDNKVIKNDNGTFSVGLTLPSEYYITSVAEYGAFVAVAAAHVSGTGKSRMFLWNRSSSLTLVSANVDWGEGVLKVIEELEGHLIGISVCNDTTRNKNRVIFRQYMGPTTSARKFHELTSSSTTTLFIAKQRKDNRVFFLLSTTLNGSVREGVWSVAHVGNGEFAIQHEYKPNNDTALGNGALKNFFIAGDFVFISYLNNAGSYALSKTSDTAAYTTTSIIETVINPNMPESDRPQKKRLVSIGALYEALPTAGSVIVKAKVNEASSYTTVFTETTDSAVKTEPVPVPSGGYMDHGSDFEFRIESTGGAVPTALIYKYEVEESNV